MKRFIFLLIVLSVLMLSCSNKNRSNQNILTGKNLTSSFINLDVDSAYTLKTAKGAIIRIEKNSFGLSSNSKVALEIKEAYTMQDILLAGLSTESNGKLLSSGGMIYINATANDRDIKLLKPIKISIPGKTYDDKMQLFKGKINYDSSINWVDPQPLDSSPVSQKMALGEKLFKANCASCHKPSMDFTGPPLAMARLRAPDPDWPYRFTKNPGSMYENDPYAKQILNKYKAAMTAFPLLSREDVTSILDYCDNEALKDGFQANTAVAQIETGQIKDSLNPCFVNDTTFFSSVATGNSIKIISNDTIPILNKPSNIGLSKPEDMEGLRSGFTDPVSSYSELYEFSIETFGWYNVDAYVEGYAGTTYVSVNVQLQMEYEFEMHMYLFCPDKKMLSVSNENYNGVYSFDKVDGKVPLFLNDEAIILAFGSKGDRLFYGTASFKIQQSQTTIIKVRETSKAELRSFIELNKIDGIKIDANKKEMIYKPDAVFQKDSVPVEMEINKVPCNTFKLDTSKSK